MMRGDFQIKQTQTMAMLFRRQFDNFEVVLIDARLNDRTKRCGTAGEITKQCWISDGYRAKDVEDHKYACTFPHDCTTSAINPVFGKKKPSPKEPKTKHLDYSKSLTWAAPRLAYSLMDYC